MFFECFAVAFIFGISPIINKYILQFIRVESVVLLSGFFYCIFALLYLLFNGHTQFIIDWRTLIQNKHVFALLLLTALLIYVVANYFYLLMLKDNKTYLVTATIAAYPLLTALFGNLLLNERISFSEFIGIMLIVSGVFILNQSSI